MLSTPHMKVAVVGAGPAGASAANALMLAGASHVALIDRARFPRDKSCGDGLGVGVIDVLERLGLAHLLEGQKRIKRFAITFHDRIHVGFDTDEHDRPSPLGHVIPRTRFDHWLVEAAFQRGAADYTGWALQSAEWTSGRWELVLHDRAAGTKRSLTADVLVGADGARSKVRRVLGVPFNDAGHTSLAVRAYIDVKPSQNAVQRFDIPPWLPHPGYGWLFSDGGGRGNIGLGFTREAFKREHVDFEDMLGRYCDFLGNQVQGRPEDVWAAILPVGSGRLKLAFPEHHAALIGDAASMVNPVVGEGIFYGMYAGLALGERLADALKAGAPCGEALRAFEAEFNAHFAAGYRSAWLMFKLLSHKRMLERLVRNFSASPDFCYDYMEFVMGVMPPRKSRSLAGLLLSAAAPRALSRLFARRS